MTTGMLVFAILAWSVTASAQPPNHFSTVQQAAIGATLGTHDGQAAFTDAVVCALHARDARWGHLKKNPGQTQIHGHAEDSALYHHPVGLLQSVDFVASAGSPSAAPAWQPDQPRYSASDWLPPHNCGAAPQPPQPPVVTPPAPVVDLSAVLAKLDALTRQINALGLQVAAVSDRAESARLAAQDARNRIEDTLTAVDLARQAINRPPIYSGRMFGTTVTLRPTVHPANP